MHTFVQPTVWAPACKQEIQIARNHSHFSIEPVSSDMNQPRTWALAALLNLIILGPVLAYDETRPIPDKVQLRGDLYSSRVKFEKEKKGTVAFIGGSITEMNGYRPMVCELLKKR